MNRILFLSILILLTTTAAPTAPAAAQQPNPLACDQMIANLAPVIYQKQLDYATITGGHLFQGLSTHATPPTTAAAPDMADQHPTDQPISWVEFMGDDLPTAMPCALQINVYTTPAGQGYEMIAVYEEPAAARALSRAPENNQCETIIAHGPETKRRGKKWTCEQPEELEP